MHLDPAICYEFHSRIKSKNSISIKAMYWNYLISQFKSIFLPKRVWWNKMEKSCEIVCLFSWSKTRAFESTDSILFLKYPNRDQPSKFWRKAKTPTHRLHCSVQSNCHSHRSYQDCQHCFSHSFFSFHFED